MIKITVTGETKLISTTLGKHKFRWHPKPKEWTKTVRESKLNQTLESITPEIANINIKLGKVDTSENPLSPVIMKFCLQDMDRSVVNVLEIFNKKISGFHLSPAPDPINPKEKKWKELPGMDDGFF